MNSTTAPSPTLEREEARRELQERAPAKPAELRKRNSMKPCKRPPRYDAVFFEGQQWLDGLAEAGDEVAPGAPD